MGIIKYFLWMIGLSSGGKMILLMISFSMELRLRNKMGFHENVFGL
jgi:hypothetical protein